MTGCRESPWSAAKLQLKKERLQCPNQQLHRNKQCIQTANVLLKITPASEVIEILTSERFENYFEWLNLYTFNKSTSFFMRPPVIDHQFRYTIVKVAVDPQTTTRTML